VLGGFRKGVLEVLFIYGLGGHRLGVPHIYGTSYLSLFRPSLWFLYTLFGLIKLVVLKNKKQEYNLTKVTI